MGYPKNSLKTFATKNKSIAITYNLTLFIMETVKKIMENTFFISINLWE